MVKSISSRDPISIDVPIISKNFQKKLAVTTAAITGVAFTLLSYIFIRPYLMDYNGEIANIQNSIKCMNEPESSLMPGCRNNVYCMQNDTGFSTKFANFYPIFRTCVNDRDHFMFNSCKRSAENDINEYLNSTSYAKQLFDKLYFETVVRFAP